MWFSASAVAPQLRDLWDLGTPQATGLTLAVQIGFVIGAVGLAITGIPDRFNSRAIFMVSAVAGAGANAGLLAANADTYGLAVTLRLLTGVALAGVYPSGMKVMAGWFQRGRGTALGVLVGALTIGSAGPHLIRGIGFDWEGVVLAASLLALVAALMMAVGVGDGPFETAPSRFSWRHLAAIGRNQGVRLSTIGYLGHMWELYAMWTWTAAFLAASAAEAGYGDGWVPGATFAVIGLGGVGSWVAGVLADRRGRTLAAGMAMAVSGACAAATPIVFGLHPAVTVAVFGVWGFAVVADSAQFSTMVTETASPEHRGTALTLQTAVGFLLTLVTIQGVPILEGTWGWRWALPLLAIGPAVGIVAMVLLRRSPARAQLAGGLG